MQFPVGCGKLETLTKKDLKSYYSYGIYHVKITGFDVRLMRENYSNYYTHIDINRALELKYNVELIEDGQPNALTYAGKLINGHKLFAKFIDYLFEFKNMKFYRIKKYINALWGALCQGDNFAIDTKKSEVTVIRDDKEILEIMPIGSATELTSYKINVTNMNKRYETDFARIKPFLAAKARYNISKVIEKNLDTVVYSHTDSVILTEPIKDVNTGDNIGDLKFEEYSECCEIFNANKKTGFTKSTDDIFTKLARDEILANKLFP